MASRLYATDPVGGPAGQPPYLNAVVVWRPAPAWSTPVRALAALLAVEAGLGRRRRERWGPRRIDLDLLDGEGWWPAPVRERGPGPALPHPRAGERAFVLVPWADVAPAWPLADGGRSRGVAERAAAGDRAGVRLADPAAAAAWARALAEFGARVAAVAPTDGDGARG